MCIFCNPNHELVYEDYFVYAMFDSYPVSKGHTLIIPKRHYEHYFETTGDEALSIHKALVYLKRFLDDLYHPDGYNIGINNGSAAGQTIYHLHVHLIPRYAGDVNVPRGGVRCVIPEKKEY